MLLTPLYLLAASLSETVTDKLYRYQTLMYWDRNSHKFVRESRRRHNWCWFFMNFVILGIICIPCCVTFLLQSQSSHISIWIFEVLCVSTHLVLYLMTVCAAVAFLTYTPEGILFLNSVVIFEERLQKGCEENLRMASMLRRHHISAPTYHQGKSMKRCQTRVAKILRLVEKCHSTKLLTKTMWVLAYLCPSNGDVDWIGILAILVVVIPTIFPLFFSLIVVWLDMDPVFLAFRQVLHKGDLSFVKTFHWIRIVGYALGTVEVCSSFRMQGICFLLAVKGLSNCQSYLVSWSIGENALRNSRQLIILFALIRGLCAYTALVYLSMIFLFSVMCLATIITSKTLLKWYLYYSVVVITICTIIALLVGFSLVVSIDNASKALQYNWLKSCVQVTSRNSRNHFRKMVRSTRPLRIPYGSLGTFTEATRTDYFNSIGVNTFNLIFILRARYLPL